jgi:hypothetical protein
MEGEVRCRGGHDGGQRCARAVIIIIMRVCARLLTQLSMQLSFLHISSIMRLLSRPGFATSVAGWKVLQRNLWR